MELEIETLENESVFGLIYDLERIISLLREGYTSGYYPGWTLTNNNLEVDFFDGEDSQ